MAGQGYQPDPTGGNVTRPQDDNKQDRDKFREMTDDEIRLNIAHGNPRIKEIGNGVIAERATQRDTDRHTQQDSRFANIERSVDNIHEIAARPEWKRSSFWIAIIGIVLSVLALLVAWFAWRRPVPAVSVDSNTQSSHTTHQHLESAALQGQPQQTPGSQPTNRASQPQPTNLLKLWLRED